MKKLLFIVLAASVAVLSSCNKEALIDNPVDINDPSAVSGELVPFSFPASRELTKSHLDGLSFVWDEGDQIALCYGSTVTPFTYDPSTNTFNGVIDAAATGPFYVVSPYSSSLSISGSSIATEIPALQTCPAGSFSDPAAFVAVGTAADKAALEGGVQLRNSFSVLQFTITDPDIEYVVLDGNILSYESISPVIGGAVTINASGVTAIPADGNRTTAVTICSETPTMAPGTYTMAVVPSVFLKGMKMICKRQGENKAYYRSASSSVNFNRNAGKSFGSVAVAGIANRCYYIQDAYDMDVWNKAEVASDDVVFVGADIDLAGYPMSPVKGFAGTFDGQNHYIYNLSITSDNDAALFASTADTGTPLIKNIYLGTDDGEHWDGESAIVHSGSTDDSNWMYAGVVGIANGATSIKYVFNHCLVKVAADAGSKTMIGGIVGNWASTGSMYSCFNRGNVRNEAASAGAKNVIGGIAGQADGTGEIDSCINYGSLVNENDQTSFMGGIVGCTAGVDNTIKDCINFGNVYASKFRVNAFGGVGGVVGYIIKGTMSGCYAYGCVVSNSAECDTWRVTTGGIAGYLENATLKSCVAEGAVVTATKAYNVGGIAGLTENAPHIIDCKVVDGSKVIGAQRTGGIVGYAMGKTNLDISSCEVSDSEISGTLNVGGIVGWLDTGSIKYCKVTKESTVTASGDGVGGVVGRAIAKGGTSNLIDGCLIDGGSEISGKYSVGGIVGYEYPDANGPVDIYNSGVASSVTVRATACDTGGDPEKGDSMIGGIVGWARCSDSGSTFKIVNCYSHAKIVCDLAMAHPSAGGLLGYVSLSAAGTGLVSNCTANLTADRLLVGGSAVGSSSTQFGALYGILPDRAITVSNNYYIDSLPIGDAGESVVVTDNEAFAAAVYKDGSTVPAKLNAFSYSDYTLSKWKADADGNAVLDL